MNELLTNIITVVITVVVLPLITIAGNKLIKWLEAKTKNEHSAIFLTATVNAIVNSVKATFQTYVDSLKKEGTFTPEAQQEAFNKAKEAAMSLITEDAKQFIIKTYGDLDKWLEVQIESAINTVKNKNSTK